MGSMFGFILSGLLVGAAFGFVLQRGRYCVNTAFRDVIFINDFTLLRAYVLGLVTLIIGANFLEDVGWLGGSGQLYRQAFVPWANAIGGYIFGMGIVLAGGCGSGILYRVGEGLLAALVAVFGFFFGIMTTKAGLLKPLYEALTAKVVYVGEDTTPTLFNMLGVNKWVVIAVLTVAAVPFLLKGTPFKKAKKGYYWSTAGLLVGLVAVIAFWASAHFGGNARGLSFTGPLREFFLAVTMGDSQASPSLIKSVTMLGINVSWSSLYVLGVPLGAYISAKLLKEFKLKVPPANELLRVLAGGFVMGLGAQISGGCNIGQGFTGVSTLAVSSWVTTVFILLGNWTMVYFLLIKPMRD